MSATDWLVLAGVAAGCGWVGWRVSGFTAGLRGEDRRGPVRLFDAAVTAVILFLGFGLLTLT